VPLESLQEPENSRHIPRYAVACIAVILLGLGLTIWHIMTQPAAPRADRYQAVFLDDEQVFFGKLKNTSGEYLRLEQVYTTQGNPSQDQGVSPAASSGVSLVKVGNLVYGPEDAMMIRSDTVKFWQDLKTDSKISKAIDAQQ
jgi:hypothetical protein